MREDLLRLIGDSERVITEQIEDKYLSDTLGRRRGTAAALVFPLSTNLVGSTVPRGQGIILDFSRMNHILEVDEATFTATVEPGVLLKDFQAHVEAMGLFYPPDPGEKESTLAGNISTNAGGMRAVKYGVTRDYVRGLEIVLADGQVMTVGSKNVKDASGLPLKQLFIGAEGTLGVITKCVLRLVPKPEKSLSVLVPYGELKTGIASVHAVLMADANPTAVEFIERSVVELGERYTGVHFPCPQAQAYLLLTFDGHGETVEKNAQRVHQVVQDNGALDYIELTDPALAADIWRVRGCFVKAVEAVSEQEPVDLVVPIDKTAEFIAYVHELEAESGMQMVSFGHAGDGNVHLCIVRGQRDEETWNRELHRNMERLYRKAYDLGGLTSGEHGVGLAKQPYFLENTPDINLAVMRSVKDALDNRHILNDHISYLK